MLLAVSVSVQAADPSPLELTVLAAPTEVPAFSPSPLGPVEGPVLALLALTAFFEALFWQMQSSDDDFLDRLHIFLLGACTHDDGLHRLRKVTS